MGFFAKRSVNSSATKIYMLVFKEASDVPRSRLHFYRIKCCKTTKKIYFLNNYLSSSFKYNANPTLILQIKNTGKCDVGLVQISFTRNLK